MDAEPLLLSQGRKKIAPEVDPDKLLHPVGLVIVVPLGIYYLLWKNVPAIRGVLDIAVMISWLGAVWFVRFVSVRAIIRSINRIAESFINSPGPTPDDESGSNGPSTRAP